GCPSIALRDGAGALRPFAAVNAQVGALPANCYTFFRDFPGGFTPRFGGVVRDASLVSGVRGTTAGGLRWDASASQGRSEVDFYIYNTVNASMGPIQPDGYRFNPGAYEQTETNFNLDLVKVF